MRRDIQNYVKGRLRELRSKRAQKECYNELRIKFNDGQLGPYGSALLESLLMTAEAEDNVRLVRFSDQGKPYYAEWK